VTGLRDRLLTAPRWVVGLAAGVPFGAFMGLYEGLRHGHWGDALIAGVIAGAVYGAIYGVFMHRRFGRYREAIGGVPQRDVRRAAREARKGRVPQDPEARRSAYRLLDVQLGELRRQRRWAPVFFVLILTLSVFLALTQTPWWWVIVPFWLAMLVMHLVLPRRMGRRLELLRD
jgi:Flp pilus assembly protein TadB